MFSGVPRRKFGRHSKLSHLHGQIKKKKRAVAAHLSTGAHKIGKITAAGIRRAGDPYFGVGDIVEDDFYPKYGGSPSSYDYYSGDYFLGDPSTDRSGQLLTALEQTSRAASSMPASPEAESDDASMLYHRLKAMRSLSGSAHRHYNAYSRHLRLARKAKALGNSRAFARHSHMAESHLIRARTVSGGLAAAGATDFSKFLKGSELPIGDPNAMRSVADTIALSSGTSESRLIDSKHSPRRRGRVTLSAAMLDDLGDFDKLSRASGDYVGAYMMSMITPDAPGQL